MNLVLELAFAYETTCPYCNKETDICDASCSSLEIDEYIRAKYCANEDYDECPIFLVKKWQGGNTCARNLLMSAKLRDLIQMKFNAPTKNVA